jgi:hypothetical protein
VKRSGRDEPIQVVIHMCMEAMLGISLNRYLYLKLTKMVCLSYYHLCFLFNKIGEEGRTGFACKRSRGDREGMGAHRREKKRKKKKNFLEYQKHSTP